MDPMSSLMQRFSRMNPASRTRLIMTGAVAGALLAIAITVGITTSDSPGADGADPRSAPARVKAAYEVPVGACLHWSESDGSDMHRVSCLRPHQLEVTEIRDLSRTYPKGAKAPSIGKWQALAKKECASGVKRYLRKSLDPHGKLRLTVVRPSEADWHQGKRQVRCGVQWIGPGGGLRTLTGPARKLDQSDVWPSGTCLALVNKTLGDPVDCAKAHSYEMIAKVDLSTEFGKSYPSEGKQKAWLDTKCAKLAQTYTGGKNLEKQKLILTWDTRKRSSWAAGSYLVNCKVAAVLKDGSGLAPVTGSIAKGAKKPSATTTTSRKPKAG